jgi:Na+-translocating ferredoxin:NAD+ oxidoreductase RnfG subunit
MIGKHATNIYTENGVTNVIYHQTKVVGFNEDEVILNSGGHHTATTKRRMNETSETFGLGYHVFQEGFTWYVRFKGEVVKFVDGLILFRKPKKTEKGTLNFFDCVREVR